ncbi:hypothetical protein ACWEWU_14260 [Staphylococcus xylosus]
MKKKSTIYYETRKSYLKQKLFNSDINLDQYAESLESYRLFLLKMKWKIGHNQ